MKSIEFCCPSCRVVVNGTTYDKQITPGSSPESVCFCPLCKKEYLTNMLLPGQKEFWNKEVTVEDMMYDPTKIDKDGREYDMQPRSRR